MEYGHIGEVDWILSFEKESYPLQEQALQDHRRIQEGTEYQR
jgi:hypothetical protein